MAEFVKKSSCFPEKIIENRGVLQTREYNCFPEDFYAEVLKNGNSLLFYIYAFF